MRQSTLFAMALATALLLAGGVSKEYLPPNRPLAGMYPSVLPPSELGRFHNVQTDEAELESHLRELGLWEPLVRAGLLQTELRVVARGLARRGYGELDARRCNSGIRWVAFVGLPKGMITILAESDKNELVRGQWPAGASGTPQS